MAAQDACRATLKVGKSCHVMVAHMCCSHANQAFSIGDKSGLCAGQGSTKVALASMRALVGLPCYPISVAATECRLAPSCCHSHWVMPSFLNMLSHRSSMPPPSPSSSRARYSSCFTVVGALGAAGAPRPRPRLPLGRPRPRPDGPFVPLTSYRGVAP